jgi:predicted O-methyltransferase YrrM
VFVSIWQKSLNKALEIVDSNGKIRFFLKRALGLLTIPEYTMSGKNLKNYFNLIARDKNVLEFGAGGSTIFFAEICNHVTSVESDRYFIDKLESQLLNKNFSNKVEFYRANIGPVSAYGQPLGLTRKIFEKKFKLYSGGVFLSREEKTSKRFDIVFIDGRFRVACVMSSLLSLHYNFLLVIDDYFDRTEYQIVEKVLGTPQLRISNAAIFEITIDSIDLHHCRNILDLFLHDSR